MAQVTLGGNPCNTIGTLPRINDEAPDFKLVDNDLADKTLRDYDGKKIILNIFPSVDTGVCATSVRKFNESVASLENTVVLCISKDLPFAQKRFCGAEGIENAITVSAFRDQNFGKDYGVELIDGGFQGLYARAVVVINEAGVVQYTELVDEIGKEPDYDAALAFIK